MPKEQFSIRRVTKPEAATLLLRYHYLKDISKGFKSGVNYGLFDGATLVGVCIYTKFPVPELAVGMLGLARDDQAGLWELSRLVLTPEVQAAEHNLASWFVSRTLRLLRQEEPCRVVLSYADAAFHTGTVYKACNFGYYGLSTAKKDFWYKQPNGSFVKHSRGKVKGVEGEWRERSRKHRFVIVFDKKLSVRWEKAPTSFS